MRETGEGLVIILLNYTADDEGSRGWEMGQSRWSWLGGLSVYCLHTKGPRSNSSGLSVD